MFVFRADDDPERPVVESTPAEAWVTLTSRLKGFRKRNIKRKRTPTGECRVFGLSGAHFFGFGLPVVRALIEQLPEAFKVSHFILPSSSCRPVFLFLFIL